MCFHGRQLLEEGPGLGSSFVPDAFIKYQICKKGAADEVWVWVKDRGRND